MVAAVRRHELSDEEWALLAPLLPPPCGAGRPYHDHRTVLNGILFWYHTGIPWRDLPERYGKWQTVYSRLRRWQQRGLWDAILRHLQRELDGLGQIEWTLWCIDGSSVRAHKAAAGAGKKPGDHRAGRAGRSRPGPEPRRRRHEGAPRH
jgi:transposase